MNTLERFASSPLMIPSVTGIYLADLGEAKGKQELLTKQSPQKLKTLREHAIIESAVSSNRIEGITVERSRIATVVFGKSILKDRDEEEVRGYRNALKLIHESGSGIPINEDTVKHLHSLSRGGAGDAGIYKQLDGNIIEKYTDGWERIRFKTVPAAETVDAMKRLVLHWNNFPEHMRVPDLLRLAAWNFDFLCVHPFRDGNGRVSRLMLLLQLYHLGYEVGRYISLERIIEETKDRYYETLEQSSEGWHSGKHDPWPYINYILYTIKTAYNEFESSVSGTSAPRGSKRLIVEDAVNSLKGDFSVNDVLDKCPGVSIDTVRKIFKDMQKTGSITCIGRGRDAKWRWNI
jgi:Fic family protein